MRKRIEIFDGEWSVKDVKNSNKIFIYGDNDIRIGKGGQAVIRGLSNSIGIRTKKKPNYSLDSYWSDDDLELNKLKIIEDITKIKLELISGKTIVLSKSGYGTGRAKLKEKAPETFRFLSKMLLENLYFNNESGTLCLRIPSHREMILAKEVPMNYEHGKIGFGQDSPGYFRKELLDIGVTSTYDAIKSGLRIGTSRSEKYNIGDLIKVTSKKTDNYLICRVVIESYPVRLIEKETWCKLEGWDMSYFRLNSGIIDKFQFQFEWICEILPNGSQIFNPRLI